MSDAWHLVGRTPLVEHPILRIERQELVNPRTGTARPFFVMTLPDWVSVVVLTPEREVVCVHQFRAGIGARTVELPGGLVDAGEDPADAARREVLEETGYTGGTLEPLGWVHPNPPLQSNRCWFYLLHDARRTSEPALDPGEDIEVERVALQALEARIASGEVSHALVQLAVARALRALSD